MKIILKIIKSMLVAIAFPARIASRLIRGVFRIATHCAFWRKANKKKPCPTQAQPLEIFGIAAGGPSRDRRPQASTMYPYPAGSASSPQASVPPNKVIAKALQNPARPAGNPSQGASFPELSSPSRRIRKKAIKRIGGLSDPQSLQVLATHLNVEPDLRLQAMITKVLTQSGAQAVLSLINQEKFDQAEALAARLLLRLPKADKIQDQLQRLSWLRKHKAAAENETRWREAYSHIQAAAQMIAQNQYDRAEALVRKAIAIDPLNTKAREILENLPSLRDILVKNLNSQIQTDKAQRIAQYRAAAVKFLAEQALDRATEALNELNALEPNDPWANAMIEALPGLQKNKRRLFPDRSEYEILQAKCERLNNEATLKKKFQDAYQKIIDNLQKGNLEAIGPDLLVLLAQAPEDSQYRQLLQRLPEIRRAADLLKRFTQDSENRQRSQGLLREGQNLFQQRRYRECITKLQQVLAHSPLEDQALTLLQRALEAQALTTRAARIRARTPLNEFGELLST